MLARDLDLLVLGVTGDADDLHAVHQGRRNVERVRRRDEHHVGEIVVDLEVWSLKVWFCSGSSTSSSAEDGSPRKSAPILSTSSSKNSGFDDFALRIDWMTLPGIEPI